MLVIYYTAADGCITNHHKAPEVPLYELQELVSDWNKKNPEKQAHIKELDEGGFEKYLYDRVERGVRYSKETIEAALEALDEARSCIDGLEVAT